MSGDLYATGAAGSGPLPPAFSQRPLRAPGSATGEQRPQPPFFPHTPAEESSPVSSAPGPIAPTDEGSISELPYEAPAEPAIEAGLPFEAPAIPAFDAPLPFEAPAEPMFDEPLPFEAPAEMFDEPLPFHAPPEPMSGTTPDLSALVAARLELFARRLRERGSAGLAESFSGDPLDLALASLVSGYLAGRGD